jgi:hypothetical protein
MRAEQARGRSSAIRGSRIWAHVSLTCAIAPSRACPFRIAGDGDEILMCHAQTLTPPTGYQRSSRDVNLRRETPLGGAGLVGI